MVRNDLIHKGGLLTLEIDKLNGLSFHNDYLKNIENYIKVEGQNISNSEKEHFNVLVMGCCVFVGEIAQSLFDEDWLRHLRKQ